MNIRSFPRLTGALTTVTLLVGLAAPLGGAAGARIRGRVTDLGSAPLSGASVSLIESVSDGVSVEYSDDLGLFVFDSVQPGRYRIAVHYGEIDAATDDEVTFDAGVTYTLDLPIDVGRPRR